METFLIRALQLILSLSILVVLHEFGHFSFARLFNVRVDKFYMFFNPNISLVRAKKINGKWQIKFLAKNVPANERPVLDKDGDKKLDSKGNPLVEAIPLSELPDGDWRKYPDNTEWGIGWLPLGGYCKIAGMVDESMDKVQMAEEPKQWEFRSRPVWQRMPIIIGGVLVNFILALVIYAAVLFTWGKEYLPLENARYGLQFSKTLLDNGFKNGDNIVSIDGQPVVQRADIVEKLLIDGHQAVKVMRDGQLIDVMLPADFTQKVLAAGETDFVSIRFPFVINNVTADSPASEAGLQVGDSIVGVNGEPMFAFQDVAAQLLESKDSQIEIQLIRNNSIITAALKPTEKGKLGVGLRSDSEFMKTKKTEYGFFESIPAGINLGVETLGSYIKQFKIVFTKEGSKHLGGFGSIGKMFPATWDWQIFWNMTALLSVILAFMNFLPIPALDGGYVIYLIYELITGRKPNEKFMEYAQTAGFFLLMALVLYSNGNDIFNAFFK